MTEADVLVIDDQPGPRDSLRMILKGTHRVRTASSGPEGLDMIRQQKPDLVFLDIKMPGMDGVEVLQRIKKFDADIEVAIITAYAAVESAQEAVRYGALDYLTKPFGLNDVRDVVARALQRQQKRAEQEAMTAQLRQISETLARRLGELTNQPGDADPTALYEQLTSAHSSIADQLSRVGRLNAIGEIAAEVAHDVNNFLSTILLRIEMLLMKTRSSDQLSAEEVAEGLHEMYRVAQDSVQTVERIAGFSRSDPFEPDERLQIEELLREAADTSIGASSRGRDQKIVWELDQIPPIVGNATALRTVFVNLFINARQAMEGPGEIRVATCQRGNNVEVEISDNGCGMSPGVLERVSQPFFTTKEEGTGLGLSIAQKIVDRHGGYLLFDSVPDVGTTVTVSLPVEGPESASEQSAGPPDVLVIDDDQELVDSLRDLFEAQGWVISSATSGVGGLAELESCLREYDQAPRAVIVDLRLSDLSGTDLAQCIKQIAPEAYTVLLSAYLAQEPQAGVSPYFDSVMAKPCSSDEIVGRIAEVTGLPTANSSPK